MAEIKARPTVYKGIQMRSRLEADYAAYLDRRGVRWGHEPECFASENGQWLPDFGYDYAPEDDTEGYAYLVEVKPAQPLREMYRRSPGAWTDHVDLILGRMTIARASRPDAILSLVFWEYQAERAYLEVCSLRHDHPWVVFHAAGPQLLWAGMGQYKAARLSLVEG